MLVLILISNSYTNNNDNNINDVNPNICITNNDDILININDITNNKYIINI